MASIRSTVDYALVLTGGRVLPAHGTATADTGQQLEASLLAAGAIQLVDADAPAPNLPPRREVVVVERTGASSEDGDVPVLDFDDDVYRLQDAPAGSGGGAVTFTAVPYSGGMTVAAGDFVTSAGSLFQAKTPATGPAAPPSPPATNSQWLLVVAKGDPGAPGQNGIVDTTSYQAGDVPMYDGTSLIPAKVASRGDVDALAAQVAGLTVASGREAGSGVLADNESPPSDLGVKGDFFTVTDSGGNLVGRIVKISDTEWGARQAYVAEQGPLTSTVRVVQGNTDPDLGGAGNVIADLNDGLIKGPWDPTTGWTNALALGRVPNPASRDQVFLAAADALPANLQPNTIVWRRQPDGGYLVYEWIPGPGELQAVPVPTIELADLGNQPAYTEFIITGPDASNQGVGSVVSFGLERKVQGAADSTFTLVTTTSRREGITRYAIRDTTRAAGSTYSYRAVAYDNSNPARTARSTSPYVDVTPPAAVDLHPRPKATRVTALTVAATSIAVQYPPTSDYTLKTGDWVEVYAFAVGTTALPTTVQDGLSHSQAFDAIGSRRGARYLRSGGADQTDIDRQAAGQARTIAGLPSGTHIAVMIVYDGAQINKQDRPVMLSGSATSAGPNINGFPAAVADGSDEVGLFIAAFASGSSNTANPADFTGATELAAGQTGSGTSDTIVAVGMKDMPAKNTAVTVPTLVLNATVEAPDNVLMMTVVHRPASVRADASVVQPGSSSSGGGGGGGTGFETLTTADLTAVLYTADGLNKQRTAATGLNDDWSSFAGGELGTGTTVATNSTSSYQHAFLADAVYPTSVRSGKMWRTDLAPGEINFSAERCELAHGNPPKTHPDGIRRTFANGDVKWIVGCFYLHPAGPASTVGGKTTRQHGDFPLNVPTWQTMMQLKQLGSAGSPVMALEVINNQFKFSNAETHAGPWPNVLIPTSTQTPQRGVPFCIAWHVRFDTKKATSVGATDGGWVSIDYREFNTTTLAWGAWKTLLPGRVAITQRMVVAGQDYGGQTVGQPSVSQIRTGQYRDETTASQYRPVAIHDSAFAVSANGGTRDSTARMVLGVA